VIHHKKKARDTTPDRIEDANKIFNGHGFHENNIHGVMLQAKIDELMLRLKTDEYINTTIFKINEECKAKFVHQKGSKANIVNLGKDAVDGTIWVYFWLMGKSMKPENLTDASLLQRDKKKSKAEHVRQQRHAQFSKEMQQA
jgi:hypothetical protein